MEERNDILPFENHTHRVSTTIRHERAGRYAKQMISHWRRNPQRLDVDGDVTVMHFETNDDATRSAIRFDVAPTEVTITIAAASTEYAAAVAEVIDEHLHRFAGTRDTLEIAWK